MVYFIRIDGTDYVKIGRAVDVQKRLANLSVAHPMALEVVHTIKTANSTSDAVLEKRLHAHLKTSRVRGEWFVLTNEQLTRAINDLENGKDYELNPIIDGKYLCLRASVQLKNGFVSTITEPCFFCHIEHGHGAISMVQVVNGIQTYGHRGEHCTIRNITRRHPNGQMLSNEHGYYLWIENPDEEAERRHALTSRASYVPDREYYYAPRQP